MRRLSYSFLIPFGLLLGLAPFVPEPHLFEKLRMLFSGQLSRPIDIFDLFLHGTLPALLLMKALGDLLGKMGGVPSEGGPAAPEEGGGSDDPPAPSPKARTRAERRREERETGKG